MFPRFGRVWHRSANVRRDPLNSDLVLRCGRLSQRFLSKGVEAVQNQQHSDPFRIPRGQRLQFNGARDTKVRTVAAKIISLPQNNKTRSLRDR